MGSAAHRGVLRYVGRYAKRSLVDDLARGVERHDLTDGAGRRPKNEISCAEGRWSFEQSYRPCFAGCRSELDGCNRFTNDPRIGGKEEAHDRVGVEFASRVRIIASYSGSQVSTTGDRFRAQVTARSSTASHSWCSEQTCFDGRRPATSNTAATYGEDAVVTSHPFTRGGAALNSADCSCRSCIRRRCRPKRSAA
jgi:hypothetical protein